MPPRRAIMAETSASSNRAVLIDAENVSAEVAEHLFRKVSGIGGADIRRAYGNFSGSRLKSWKAILPKYKIDQRQSCELAAGKNASDIALAVEAMDLLRDGTVSAFYLVS